MLPLLSTNVLCSTLTSAVCTSVRENTSVKTRVWRNRRKASTPRYAPHLFIQFATAIVQVNLQQLSRARRAAFIVAALRELHASVCRTEKFDRCVVVKDSESSVRCPERVCRHYQSIHWYLTIYTKPGRLANVGKINIRICDTRLTYVFHSNC